MIYITTTWRARVAEIQNSISGILWGLMAGQLERQVARHLIRMYCSSCVPTIDSEALRRALLNLDRSPPVVAPWGTKDDPNQLISLWLGLTFDCDAKGAFAYSMSAG